MEPVGECHEEKEPYQNAVWKQEFKGGAQTLELAPSHIRLRYRYQVEKGQDKDSKNHFPGWNCGKHVEWGHGWVDKKQAILYDDLHRLNEGWNAEQDHSHGGQLEFAACHLLIVLGKRRESHTGEY